MATVTYRLVLSNPQDLSITKITFGTLSKTGNELQEDYNDDLPGYEGTFSGVNTDCSTLFIEIFGDGLNGTKSTLTVDACFGLHTLPPDIETTTSNGNHSLSNNFTLTS